jgi:uncharacterized protein (DUF2126 family)
LPPLPKRAPGSAAGGVYSLFDSEEGNKNSGRGAETLEKSALNAPASPFGASGGAGSTGKTPDALPQLRRPLQPLSAEQRDAQRLALPQRFASAHWITRTALCIETRNPARANGPKAEKANWEQPGQTGVLYIFMPPLGEIEDYLNLVAAIEATAQELNMPVVLEGYPPPRDPRLKSLAITPDPGVIEVNIHPAESFAELSDNTEFLYQAAFECRLSAEKFMLDGRHSGTGGGNHITLGGANATQSPFLRRPPLLSSLVSYWNNHPSLHVHRAHIAGPALR